MNHKLLLVDDDDLVHRTLLYALKDTNLDIRTTDCPIKALEILKEEPFSIVLTDLSMPKMTGLELLKEIKHLYPNTTVIIMTGLATIKDAVSAIQKGAFDYISKPIVSTELKVLLRRALKEKSLEQEVVQLRAEVERQYSPQNIIGNTPAIKDCFDLVEAVAGTEAIVLLTGSTGTGKELFARSIHYSSGRAKDPFLAINCASLPKNLLESELFGHEKGAFTGATRQHKGKFEQAAFGTLFLDEIGEIDIHVQAKLLRILENGEYQRVGGTQTLRNNARIISATNKRLRSSIEAGSFREDLYFRLNVFEIQLPDLKKRLDDIPLLTQHFIQKFNKLHNRSVQDISPEVTQTFQDYEWPGNIRELEHCIERAVLLSRSHQIELKNLPTELISHNKISIPKPSSHLSLVENLQRYERELVVEALKENAWIQARAARSLGLSRANLYQRLKRLSIQVPKD